MSKYSDFKEWHDAFEADISDVAVDQFCDFNAQSEVWMIEQGANPDIF